MCLLKLSLGDYHSNDFYQCFDSDQTINKKLSFSVFSPLFFLFDSTLIIFVCSLLDPYRPGGPVTPIIEPFPVDPINPGPFPPNPPSTLTCQFGHQIDQQGRCTNFISIQQCPAGFFCNFGPADEPGPCCLS